MHISWRTYSYLWHRSISLQWRLELLIVRPGGKSDDYGFDHSTTPQILEQCDPQRHETIHCVGGL